MTTLNLKPDRARLQIWIKKDLIISNVIPIPLITHKVSEHNPKNDLLSHLKKTLSDIVEIRFFQDIEEAGNLVAIPHSLEHYFLRKRIREIYDFRDYILATGRRPIIFTGLEYVPKRGEIVFSNTTYRNDNGIAIATPAWVEDLGSKVKSISKPRTPTVGFVGNTKFPGVINSLFRFIPIPNLLVNYLASSAYFNQHLPIIGMRSPIAKRLRERVLKEVLKSKDIVTDFKPRDRCYFNELDEGKSKREEFINSMQNNAYHLCMRGFENFSFRLYEVMSAGRIPIIIDTNMRFPKLDSIDWPEFSVIIPYSKIRYINFILETFHKRLSNTEFKNMCQKARLAFELLLPDRFLMSAIEKIEKAVKV